MTEQSITKLIGKPAEISLRNLKPIGSTGFYLKSFESIKTLSNPLKINSKCNFEKRKNGILLRSNFSNKLIAIPFPKEDIVKITLTRGKENIKPFVLSPLWILLKLNVPIIYARYFRLTLQEYSIEQMKLYLKTNEYEMSFIANGYLFERQLSFFENLNYGHKITIKR
jgi:hypothetical protein